MLEMLSAIALTVIRFLPVSIVYIVGISIAFSKKQRYPKASLLAISGFCILLLSTVLSALAQTIPLLYYSHSPQTIGIILSISSLILGAFYVIGMILIVMAIFADRK